MTKKNLKKKKTKSKLPTNKSKVSIAKSKETDKLSNNINININTGSARGKNKSQKTNKKTNPQPTKANPEKYSSPYATSGIMGSLQPHYIINPPQTNPQTNPNDFNNQFSLLIEGQKKQNNLLIEAAKQQSKLLIEASQPIEKTDYYEQHFYYNNNHLINDINEKTALVDSINPLIPQIYDTPIKTSPEFGLRGGGDILVEQTPITTPDTVLVPKPETNYDDEEVISFPDFTDANNKALQEEQTQPIAELINPMDEPELKSDDIQIPPELMDPIPPVRKSRNKKKIIEWVPWELNPKFEINKDGRIRNAKTGELLSENAILPKNPRTNPPKPIYVYEKK